MTIRPLLLTCFLFISMTNGSFVYDIKDLKVFPADYQTRDSMGNQSIVLYQLFTRNNPWDRQTLLLGDVDSVRKSNFNASWPVKMYAGGACYTCDGGNVRVKYLARGNYNFITIDWQMVTTSEENIFPNSRIAGQHAAAFIDFLIDTTGVPLSAFHVSGHSAGAQIAGAVGLGYRERHNNTKLIPRITGLDPGNYIPDLSDLDNYIDATDGAFVDVIHTDQYSGIYQPIGHADFYPNGGKSQPGCPNPEQGQVDDSCCNHCRALWLFDDSITSQLDFVSYRCDSYESYKNGSCFGNDKQMMGEFATSSAKGLYFLDTNADRPYAMG